MSTKDLHDAAIEWARRDRACDDRAAELNQIEEAIVRIAPRRSEALHADREGAVVKLRIACKEEERARHALEDASNRLLDAIEQEAEPSERK